jgi:hypothetical protein
MESYPALRRRVRGQFGPATSRPTLGDSLFSIMSDRIFLGPNGIMAHRPDGTEGLTPVRDTAERKIHRKTLHKTTRSGSRR